MAWHCQRPNISYNEKKLFDEYYKTLFHIGYDPLSVQALNSWMIAIEAAWPNLAINDALKAGKSYAKFHVLFSVSAIINGVNKCTIGSVVEPYATLKAVEQSAKILPHAASCLENAMQQALESAQISSKVFSPPNWLKSIASVQGEQLTAAAVANLLCSFSIRSMNLG
jgi:hypothetical protein